MLCSIQTYRPIGTSSMNFHIIHFWNLVITVYICSIPFKLIGILVHLAMKTSQKNIIMSHIMSFLPYIYFLCFLLLLPWGFIPTSLTFALIAMCHGTRTPDLVSDALGLYTHRSYTCSAKISFNLGFTFRVTNFVICHAHHIL
jgi:hypothetical protein